MLISLSDKLKDLPKSPGVYFFKDAKGQIIYIGKAAVLKNRVRQYFQSSRSRDQKTEALVGEIADVEWQEVDSELDALFLEAELIRRYMPRYNILLRDDKSLVFVRVDYDSDHPTVTTTRRPLDDKAHYFGPYLSGDSIRRALKVLRRIFPYSTGKSSGQKRVSLHYHLGLDPGLEEGKTTLADYRSNLRRLMAVLAGKRKTIEKSLEKDIAKFAKNLQFEEAIKARDQLGALKNLSQQVVFGDSEFLDISKDVAINELSELLGLYEPESEQSKRPIGISGSAREQNSAVRLLRRIEGYDISHMSGTDVVASMVVFSNGVPNKAQYRKFKVAQRNDDFANIHQTIIRRFKHLSGVRRVDTEQGDREQRTESYKEYDKRVAELTTQSSATSTSRVSGSAGKQGSTARSSWWGMPDLVLIDGGKGQLDSAIRARNEATVQGSTLYSIPFVGLAKREEQIVIRKAEAGQTFDVAQVKRAEGRPSTLLSLKEQSLGSGLELNYRALHKLGGYAKESGDFILVNLPHNTNLVKLLQRIRDESHRFAVSYHSTLKTKRVSASILDDIPGIGPATRKKLIKHFGSAKAVLTATEPELTKIIAPKLAAKIKTHS